VLEARELQGGNRLIGLARWQYGRVHAGMMYDLEVDTSCATPVECAGVIKHKFGLQPATQYLLLIGTPAGYIHRLVGA